MFPKHVMTMGVALFSLSGCGEFNDRVLFVTNQSFLLDADAATGQAGFGYNRTEAVIGPVFEGGELPPVLARMETGGNWLTPKIQQFYATGDAARLITDGPINNGNTPKNKEVKDNGLSLQSTDVSTHSKPQRKVFFIGTRTNTGIAVNLSQVGLSSVVLGYKRQEISYLPIGRDADDKDLYPSALALFQLNIDSNKYGVGQLIATGDAASGLARKIPMSHQSLVDYVDPVFDGNAIKILAAIVNNECANLVKEYIGSKILVGTPSIVDAVRSPSYATLRKELIQDKAVSSGCGGFSNETS